MFQYASLRAIASSHDAQLVLPVSCKLRRAFAVDAIFASDEIVETLLKAFARHKIDFQVTFTYSMSTFGKLACFLKVLWYKSEISLPFGNLLLCNRQTALLAEKNHFSIIIQ